MRHSLGYMENTTKRPAFGDLRQKPLIQAVRVKYCLYARKSTESEERQVLSIDSQIKEMLQLADREGLEIVELKRESHSAKETGQRPVFNEIVDELKAGKYNGILTWAPDRISRNAGDLGKIVDLMDAGTLQEIRTHSQSFRNNPNEKFLLMILGSQAKLENDNRGVNVKRGLRTRCEMGLRPGVAPVGYSNEKHADRKCHAVVDELRAPVIKQMFEKVANEKWSGRKLYQWMKFDINFKSRANKNMTLSSVYVVLQNPFYYGVFEYPEKSGNWYDGKHKPLITKELFDSVQDQLKRDRIVRSDIKEFAFTKLMLCGSCGSGISADEKFKKLKDGTSNRYVYYGCTRSKDKDCKNGYVREEELINQTVKIIDQIDLNQISMRDKFEAEVERMRKFQRTFTGTATDTKPQKGIDLRDYAKYLLREGSVTEKRELLLCIKSKLVLTKGEVTLQK
jgi:DNA invertase Pin-like site-specific DNA recombinase